MKRVFFTLGLPIALIIMVFHGRPAQATPMSELKRAQQTLNQLAKQNASDAKLKRFVNRLLDFDTMAENTLQDHWAGLKSAQKAEFKRLFKGLIEKNYIKGIRKNAKYSVDYKQESAQGRKAKVRTVVHSVRRGRPRETIVIYRMHRSGGRWVVIDVITDDVSMEQNYRKSFNRIIKDKGWPELINKMKRKLAEK